MLLGPWIRPGMCVADLGCGWGYFTVPLAELVGETGHVQAVDLQPRQLERVQRRVEQAGLASRVTRVQASPGRLGLEGQLDFVLAFWMVHEVRDASPFFAEIREHLTPGGVLFVAEPRLHVRGAHFGASLQAARDQGLLPRPEPLRVRLSRAALLERPLDQPPNS